MERLLDGLKLALGAVLVRLTLMNMCTVALKGSRSTAWSYLVVLLGFFSILNQATAQLNLYVSKEDAKSYLSE